MDAYTVAKPLLFRLPPETAHRAVTRLLEAIQGTPVEDFIASRYVVQDQRLRLEAFGLDFPNPVGLAAGFDKNGRLPSLLANLGFGHVELGGITADAQAGNPRPRLFRLTADRALINRMGFNNDGADAIADRLSDADLPNVPLGVNLGKSEATPLEAAPDDYAYSYDRLAAVGDYFVVNVSSPNTPGLRSLQDRAPLERIVGTLQDRGASPLLVKLSPDLEEEAVAEVVSLAEQRDLAGIIATNTTTDRPAYLRGIARSEDGGLSGKPLEPRATELVRFVAERTDLPVIGVGGVFTAVDAYRKIRAGASLVQLYTGLVYRGPRITREINRGLLTLCERDGFGSVREAIGADLG